MKLAIASNRVVLDGELRKAVVIIRNGCIEAVSDELPADVPSMDLGNDVLMAGLVDPHVHINEPGRTDWEGFDTATRAALAGGITSLVEMPLNASPVTTTAAAFQKKREAAANKLHCDCGFWGGVIPGNSGEIESLADKGVWGFKAFLTPSGIDEFPAVSEEDLRKAMPVIAKLGLPLLVHCELPKAEVPTTPVPSSRYADYLDSRPADWEINAINLMIRLCEEYNCRTHIVHLSSAAALEPISRAREGGLPLTVETAPHYLYFAAENIPDGRTEFKCAPPIREGKNNEALWKGLQRGLIDFIATDHSPAPPEMKQTEKGDYFRAWGGIASLQLSLPVVWTAAKKRGFGIPDIAKWLGENPARLPGFKDRGRIAPGYRADLVAWDPEAVFEVKPDLLFHRHKFTPYQGQQLSGRVRQTWLAGEKLYEDKETGGGQGKFLHLNKGRILYHEQH